MALLLIVLCACSSSPGAVDLQTPDSAAARVGDVEVFATLPARTEGIAFGKDPGGATALYVGAADALWRLDAAGQASRVADVPDPVGIAVRADGDVLVCGKDASGREAVIWRVKPSGERSLLVGPAGYQLTNFVVVAPDDRLLFSDSGADKLYLAEADGSGARLLTDQIVYPNGLAFSKDGGTLFVASWSTRKVYQLPRQAPGYGAPQPFTSDVALVDGITTLASGALLFVTSNGLVRLEQDQTRRSFAVPDAIPANGASGRGAFGEGWLYLSNLASGAVLRHYLGEPGAPLPAR